MRTSLLAPRMPILALAVLVLGAVAPSFTLAGAPKMTTKVSPFGETPDGQKVELYEFANSRGAKVKIMTLGGIITSVVVPDKRGALGEVTLGFDSLEEYLAGHPYFGAICGRVANRIAKGKFSIDGKNFTVATNNGPNHLHGGIRGFDKVVWKAQKIEKPGEVGVRLTYRSVDGEEGYPGNLDVEVTYTFNDDNELRVEYAATTDKATTLNLTNHAYWNLADAGKSDILGHRLSLRASHFLPVDEGGIPLGKLAPVQGTPLDFMTEAKTLGERIDKVPGAAPGGYDHCYALDEPNKEGAPALAARVVEPKSGRTLEILTTEPGVQLYTGNYLDGKLASRGAKFEKRHGFCLETQHFPDSVNQPNFPSTILMPGEKFHSTTIHRFGVE